MNRIISTLILALTPLAAACVAPMPSDGTLSEGDETVVVDEGGKGDYFGEDDRKDPASEGMPDEVVTWARSTALLVRERHLEEESGGLSLDSKRLGVHRRLCGDEPHYWEPRVGGCSSFLVAPDLMVTAGHCADALSFCDTALFVFDFGFYDEEPRPNAPVRPENDPTRVTEDQLYRCSEVIDWIYDGNGVDDIDYAVVRLDRPVTDREPLKIQQEGRADVGDNVTLIGYPDGLPVKIDMGGEVIHTTDTRLVSTSDTFASNSGSVVLDPATGEVVAIHVASGGDRYETDRSCKRAKQCDEAMIESGDCQGALGVHSEIWRDVVAGAIDAPAPD